MVFIQKCLRVKGVGISMDKAKKEKVSIFKTVRMMLPYFMKYIPGLSMLHLVCSIMHGLSFGVLTWGTQYLIDKATSLAVGEIALGTAIIALFVLGGIHLVNRILNAVANYLYGVNNSILGGHLQKSIFDKIGRLSPEVFEDTDKLDDINKASNGQSNACGLVTTIFISILGFYIPYFIYMGFYLFQLKPILALSIVIIFIPNMISQLVRTKIFDKSEDESAPVRREFDYYEQCITSREYFKETRLLGAVSFFKKKYMKTLDSLQGISYKANNKTGIISICTNIVSIAGYFVVILLLMDAVLNKEISIGAFAAVLASIGTMYSIMNELIEYQIGSITKEAPLVSNYIRFLELPERNGENIEIPNQCDIRLENVSFSYPTAEKEALKNVDLTIEKGKTLAIVGENGSGKSTLIRLITGLYYPKKGDVYYDNINTKEASLSSLTEHTSAVFQKYQRYHMTLKENIVISNIEEESKENQLVEICEQAGVENSSDIYPNSFDTMLSREFDGVDLSGGQWQRVAIARAFYRAHGLIVLDEPTAAIDPYEETRIYNQFAEISKDKTAIIVTHRLGSVKLADKIVVMKEGEIVQIGSHDELLKQSGEYRRLWQAQEQWYK